MTPDRLEQADVRKRSFGAVAQAYHRIRAGYPDQLWDDVLAYAGPGTASVIEVGAGTGHATAALVERGLSVTAVEHDPAMAAVLSARLPLVQVTVGPFESEPVAGSYDLLVSAQAWHWIDPDLRWSRAAALLRPGGAMALCWHHDRVADPVLGQALQEAHDRWTPGITLEYAGSATDDEGHGEWPGRYLDRLGDFTDLVSRWYEWQRVLSAGDYVELLSTISAYNVRSPQARDGLFADVRAIVGDVVTLEMQTSLDLGRRR